MADAVVTTVPDGPWKLPQSVLVVIYAADLQVLLIRRADSSGHWQSVTGSKDRSSEHWRATAVREVHEETGLDCRPGQTLSKALRDWRLENLYAIYPQWLHRYAPGVTHNRERVFGLCLPAAVPVQLNPREHVAQQWLPWRDAAKHCFSASNAEAILMLPQFAP